MKIMFKNLVAAYTGKVDDIVIYYSRQANRCIARRLPKRKETTQNVAFRIIQNNLRRIEPSQGYKDDLSTYREQYCKTPRFKNRTLPNWMNAYTMLFYEMQRRMPGQVDLTTITRQQIMDEDLPCRSVASAVQAGLLPEVKGSQLLTSLI